MIALKVFILALFFVTPLTLIYLYYTRTPSRSEERAAMLETVPHNVVTVNGEKVDAFGEGFRSYRKFNEWAQAFENTVTLDGMVLKQGTSPPIPFVSNRDGSIVLK